MVKDPITKELWRGLLFIAVFAIVGASLGSLAWGLVAGMACILGWLIWNIRQLDNWVLRARRSMAPSRDELHGLWSEISYNVQLLMARQEKEKLRLQSVVHRVQEMTSALADGVILIDRRGNMDWWNKSAEQVFNFREVDLGHKLTNLIRHPKFIKYFDQQDYETPLELTMWRKDQHFEFHIHRFGEGERLVIVRDITRLFRLEQMRKDFVANVSHELRTPLTVIRGYVETLGDSPNIPRTWSKALQQMEQQCARMTLLISDLITLAKLETDEKEVFKTPVKVAPLMQTIISDAKAVSTDDQHSFELSGDNDLGIIGSEKELRSAISNLVVNAVNYSGKDSKIQLKFRKTADGGAVIEVCDDGVGIDPKHLPRLTERFYRVDPGRSIASGGTGLGLAIVKHVLLRHNAELKISSTPHKGSTFSCHFPPHSVAKVTRQ